MKEEITKSLRVLLQRKIILYPTDTVWGLGCDATSGEAVRKIYQLKHREESKSLSIGLFYISFFILNFATLLFDKFFFNFNDYFNITIIFWIIYILRRFKHLSKLYLFLTGLSYLLIYFFKDLVIENKFIQSELSSDTSFFWTPMSKIIYENDLFFALENNIIPGYGLLINHIHAVNYKLFINEIKLKNILLRLIKGIIKSFFMKLKIKLNKNGIGIIKQNLKKFLLSIIELFIIFYL